MESIHLYRSLKNRLRALALLPFLLINLLACSTATERAPASAVNPAAQAEKQAPLLLRPAIAIIRRHREMGTHLDGPRCPMYPSCAAYGEKAIRRHGLLGLILTVDRLFFREAGGLQTRYLFAPAHKSGHLRYYDALEDSLPFGDLERPSLLREEYRPVAAPR